MIGHGDGLNPSIKSIVDAVLLDIYKKFMKTKNQDDLPTFKEFFKGLEQEYEVTKSTLAKELIEVLKIYVTGSWSNFSNKTNVNYNNRLICYNTSNLGEHLRPVGSFMMFDAIWNKLAKGRNTGRMTYVFVDEVHLLFNSDDSIKRVDNMYRRIRKYDGSITSMTQNSSDVLRFTEARSMIGNSDFVAVMNQRETDGREIKALLNIPDNMMSNITNSGKGAGIIFFENMLIPFASRFPSDTRLYELITTNSKELAVILEKERIQREKLKSELRC